MHYYSMWLDDVKFPEYEALNENIDIDVLIIGGGITGLNVAHQLMNSNLKVCIIDKNRIAKGITARTTGKITYLQDNIYSKLKDNAKLYYQSQIEAINMIKKNIKKYDIDCDFKQSKSILFAKNNRETNKIKSEAKILEQLGISYSENINIPINNIYNIGVNNTYVFHPLKYLYAIQNVLINNNIKIYENTAALKISKKEDKYIIYCNNKEITAKYVVIASHYPYFLKPMFMPFKSYIERSYIAASLVNSKKNISGINIEKPIESFRYHNNYFIYLANTHKLCNKINYKNNYNNLMRNCINAGLKPQYLWTNHDLITIDNLPYIGFIDNNLLLATGYNTWGMTNATIAGKIISDLIIKNDSLYKKLFDPFRNKSISALKYPLYLSYNVKSFVENKLVKNKSWYKNNVKFIKINGDNLAIYIDKNNEKHIVYNKCPHLGCSLVFNEVEKTWDCPCHGSRFDIDGRCIIGPSNNNISYK